MVMFLLPPIIVLSYLISPSSCLKEVSRSLGPASYKLNKRRRLPADYDSTKLAMSSSKQTTIGFSLTLRSLMSAGLSAMRMLTGR